MSGRVKQVGEDFIPEGAENGDPDFMVADGRDSVVMSRIIGMRTALGETVTSPAWRKPDGELLTGPMHAIILMDAGMLDDYYDAQQMGWEDGFVTDTGRFVDRTEAAEIMGMAGELQSEDLQMAANRRTAKRYEVYWEYDGEPGSRAIRIIEEGTEVKSQEGNAFTSEYTEGGEAVVYDEPTIEQVATAMGWNGQGDLGEFIDSIEGQEKFVPPGIMDNLNFVKEASRRTAGYPMNDFKVGDRVTNLEAGAPESMAKYPGFGPGTVESTDGTPGGEITVKHDNGSLSDGWCSEYTKLEAQRRVALNVIVNEGEEGEEWSGPWDEFYQDNLASGGMDEDELAEIKQVIESGQTYQGGGGAAAGWTIRMSGRRMAQAEYEDSDGRAFHAMEQADGSILIVYEDDPGGPQPYLRPEDFQRYLDQGAYRKRTADKSSTPDNAGYGGEFTGVEPTDLSGYAPYAEDGNKFDISEDRAMTPNSHESVEKSLVEDTRMGRRNRRRGIWLQGIGEWSNVKAAEQLQPGDVTVWNYGYTDPVVAVTEASPQYVNVTLRLQDGSTADRRMKKGRMVAVEGSRRMAVQNGDHVKVNDPVEGPVFQSAHEDVGIPYEAPTGTVYGQPDERGNIYVQMDDSGELRPYPVDWLEKTGQRRTADDFEVGEQVEGPMGPGEVLDIDQYGQPDEEYTVQMEGGEVSEFEPSALQVMNPERVQGQEQMTASRIAQADNEGDENWGVYDWADVMGGPQGEPTEYEIPPEKQGSRQAAVVAFDDAGFDWDAEDLEEGFEAEMEHKDTVPEDEDVANIAIDHLEEDPDYYEKLPMIEGSRMAGNLGTYTFHHPEQGDITIKEGDRVSVGFVDGEITSINYQSVEITWDSGGTATVTPAEAAMDIASGHMKQTGSRRISVQVGAIMQDNHGDTVRLVNIEKQNDVPYQTMYTVEWVDGPQAGRQALYDAAIFDELYRAMASRRTAELNRAYVEDTPDGFQVYVYSEDHDDYAPEGEPTRSWQEAWDTAQRLNQEKPVLQPGGTRYTGERRTADSFDLDDRQHGVLPEDRAPGQADSFLLGEPPGGASGFEDLGDSYSPDRGTDGTNVNKMYGGKDWFGEAMHMARTAGRTRMGGMTSESVLRSIQRYRNVLPLEIVAQFENMLRYYEPDHVMTVFQSRLPELRGLE